MAARPKKRLPKIENKLLKLDKLQLHDVICSICQSILVEPVTLPCYHDFCLSCFNGSIENNALCCPLCRLRIGSWLRTTAKQRTLVNSQLWKFLQTKFSREIDTKHNGHDIEVPEDKPNLRISAPGEIRLEYEAEIKRLQTENLKIEQKHLKDTEVLIQKLQQEEEDAHEKYLERLREDEILAKKLQQSTSGKPSRSNASKARLKSGKIDSFLRKQNTKIVKEPLVKESPLLTEDNTSSDSRATQPAAASPELAPSYGRSVKNFIDKKVKTITGIWNKENGRNLLKTDTEAKSNEVSKKANSKDVKTVVHSLPVSLPYSGVLQHKLNLLTARNMDTGSADSMHQELCYFKPIDGSTTTSFKSGSGLPVRVPGVRAPPRSPQPAPPAPAPAPAPADYWHSLLRLRSQPRADPAASADPAPSAFVVALKLLWTNNTIPSESDSKSNSKDKKITRSYSQKCSNRPNGSLVHVDGIEELGAAPLRRTRSMKSFPTTNETTPKKVKVVRKAFSERKRLLRSDSKKLSLDSDFNESINNKKVKLVVKDLSSPLDKCDVKKILEEQLRIERMIEQEKRDLALARAVDEQVNGRRRPRRAAHKRLAPAAPAPRQPKKIKV